MRTVLAIAWMSVCCSMAPAMAEGDAAHGQQVFKRCAACHSVEPGVNMVGPSLAGVVGRQAGSVSDYHYSDAMKNHGVVWSADTLTPFLHAPQKTVKGTLMTFPGLQREKDVEDVIAYLKTLSP